MTGKKITYDGKVEVDGEAWQYKAGKTFVAVWLRRDPSLCFVFERQTGSSWDDVRLEVKRRFPKGVANGQATLSG